LLADVAKNSAQSSVREDAAKRLTILIRMTLEMVGKMTDPSKLANIAKNAPLMEIREAAVKQMNALKIL
jgi:hypothetical protein